MTADLDRDIVTIKYNLLNLPELIQFKNGCQIKHTYSAGGQKLSSRYITVNAGVYQPLNQGQVVENLDVNENDNVTVEGMDYIGNIEYQIYRYFDWDVTFEPAELKYIYRVHNPEGFATNATTTNGPIYSYYRKDHLGNNREVWRASYTWGSTTHAAATVQKTQYYPSGLPWKSNSGDNPGSQPYKYGGKEFVEMHGLDEYDSDARWYYPAIMRTTTMDPLAEKYYDISPYAWCANNPVKFVDPDGRFPVWAVVGAGLEYGFQVYDNYKSGKSGYDAWVGDVDFLDVGLSAVNPTGKFKVAKTLLVEGTKAVVNITQNEQIKVNANIEEVVTNTLVNTLVDVGVGKVTDAGSKKAVQNANKEVYTANQKLKTAERQAQRSPNSTKKAENVKDAQSNVQSARNKQVRTQMLNSTIGQAPNVTQQGATIISNRALKDEEKNKR
ncbi:MAG: RHS repeat-associated core domain-containing protein [Paludibacter sp.]|nr:RHS repeat-associated core domain-containing protein [Paludibacter sp.]